MSRFGNVALSPISDANGPGCGQIDHFALSALTQCGDDQLEILQISPTRCEEKLPESARLWGFVRELNPGETRDIAPRKNAKQADRDVGIWWDVERGRFLIAVANQVIDDVSPLQFVQFVRQLRYVTSRILFKCERRCDATIGPASRVWA
jgi:hypothetical protein